jgi:arylsulfatase A-like enzyme
MFRKSYFAYFILCLAMFFILNLRYAHARQEDKPNIIIITIDSLRSDHVGCYGYYRDTTPNIDKFSKDAVLFEHAIAQAPHTPGSMSSFITGIYPSSHIIGVKSLLGPAASSLNPCSITLAQVLKLSGYKTYFISDHPQMFFCFTFMNI